MIEARRQLGLAQEAFGALAGHLPVAAHHLDHRSAPEQLLLGAVDLAEPAGAQSLDHPEASEHPPDQLGRADHGRSRDAAALELGRRGEAAVVRGGVGGGRHDQRPSYRSGPWTWRRNSR
jgi:hypothetical protein